MHKLIILQSFTKAHDDLIKLSGSVPSKRKCALYLSDQIYRINKFSFGERSLRDLYKIATSNETTIIEIKQTVVVDALCKYLDYEDFPDFYFKNQVALKTRARLKKINISFKKTKNVFILIITALVIIATVIYMSINKAKWLISQHAKTNYAMYDY